MRGEERWWWWFEIEINACQCWSQFRHCPSHAEPNSDFRNTRFSMLPEVLYLVRKRLNPNFWIWNPLGNWLTSRNGMTSFLLFLLPKFQVLNFSTFRDILYTQRKPWVRRARIQNPILKKRIRCQVIWEIVICKTAYTKPNFSLLISNHFITYYILRESPERGGNKYKVRFRNKNFVVDVSEK